MCAILYNRAKNTFGVRKRSQNTKKQPQVLISHGLQLTVKLLAKNTEKLNA
jgi:hypothetical protein